jgi:hypothetical protein
MLEMLVEGQMARARPCTGQVDRTTAVHTVNDRSAK